MPYFYTLKRIQYIKATINTLDFFCDDKKNKKIFNILLFILYLLPYKKTKKIFIVKQNQKVEHKINRIIKKIKEKKNLNINDFNYINNQYLFYNDKIAIVEKSFLTENNISLSFKAKFCLNYYKLEQDLFEIQDKKTYNLLNVLNIVLSKNTFNITCEERDIIQDSYSFTKNISFFIKKHFKKETKDKLEGLYGPKYFK